MPRKFLYLNIAYVVILFSTFLFWSDIYHYHLSEQLYLFMGGIFLINTLAWLIDSFAFRHSIKRARSGFHSVRHHQRDQRFIFDFSLLLFVILNFVVAGSMPILMLIAGGDYKGLDYLPGFSLLIIPLCIYRCIYLFGIDRDCIKKNIIILSYMLFFLSLVSRIIIITVAATLFLYWVRRTFAARGGVPVTKIFLRISAVVVCAAVGFGVAGEFRSKDSRENQSATAQGSSLIEYLAEPSEEFRDSGVGYLIFTRESA